MSDMHEDEPADRALIQSLVDAILHLAERLECLEKYVHEDFVGGIKKLYQSNVRNEGIEGLKGKYGDKLSRFEPAIKALFGEDYDTFGNLHDHLEGLKKSSDGWDDEKEGGAIEELLSRFGGAFKGTEEPKEEAMEEEVKEAPEAVVVEETTKPVDEKAELIKQVMRVKARK